MNIVISGQSGLDKSDFVESLKEFIEKKGKKVCVFHIGKLICKERGVNEEKILNLKINELDALRKLVFERILSEIEKKNPENVIINTHNVFRWENALFPAFNRKYLSNLEPDIYISLIDDVDAVYLRLKKTRPSSSYTLKDLMVWREEEMIITDTLANFHNCPHYVLSVNYGPQIIYKLMYENYLTKVYTSFPITLIRDIPELVEEVRKFREWVNKRAIAFDPYCAIGEKRLHYELERAIDNGQNKIRIKTLGEEIEFNVSDISEIVADIDGQIIYRDFRLIDQSDMVLAYIPTIGEKPQLSSGGERELEYGHDNGKKVYVICNLPKKLSPWINQRVDGVFKNFDEAKGLFNVTNEKDVD